MQKTLMESENIHTTTCRRTAQIAAVRTRKQTTAGCRHRDMEDDDLWAWHRVGVRFPADQNFYHFDLIAGGQYFYQNFYHFKLVSKFSVADFAQSIPHLHTQTFALSP